MGRTSSKLEEFANSIDSSVLKSAIVLGTNVNGIAVIRSLGRMGVTCGAIYTPEYGDFAAHSRYLKFAHPVEANANATELRVALDTVASFLHEDSPVLVATTDRFSQFLSENQDSLSQRFIYTCAETALYDAFLDKWKTATICRHNSILIPDTFCPSNITELQELGSSLRFPVIVKPRYTFDEGFPGKNAVIKDFDSLLRFFSQHNVVGRAVVQEIIPSGDGDILVTASYSGADGRVRAMYSGRKIRQYLPDYGATCFGISERHVEVERQSRAFLDSIGYMGFAALEFSRSRIDGRPYFLELNTRTYYHNQLFSDAGLDLTQIGYLDMIGQHNMEIVDQLVQREGIVWLDYQRDRSSMKIKRRQGQITILEWMGSIVRARSFAYWNWRDPIPFLTACIFRIRQLCRKYLIN